MSNVSSFTVKHFSLRLNSTIFLCRKFAAF